MIHHRLQILVILFISIRVCLTLNWLQQCQCVSNNRCYPNLSIDDESDIDIRIGDSTAENPGGSPGNSCPNGLIQCCTECGVNYYINSGPRPAAGQGVYGAQPWQTIILDHNSKYLGGGVLIDEKHVITAAHKIYQFQNNPSSILVRLGEWNSGNNYTEPYRSQDSIVNRIFIHKEYSDPAKNLVNDIAVLKLNTAIRYGPTVNPAINTACLPNATMNFNNIRCIVSGWGKNSFDGSYQAILNEVDVPVVSNSVCEERLRTTKLGSSFNLDTRSFICAGGESGKDACVGDGGSPLMCKIGNRFVVAGLVAWGIGCATGNIPGVYVRVQSYLDFIGRSMNAA